jgi:predicted component of type VI protein secretion system
MAAPVTSALRVGLGRVGAVAVVDKELLDAGTEGVAERDGGGLVPDGAHVHPPPDRAGPHPMAVEERWLEGAGDHRRRQG